MEQIITAETDARITVLAVRYRAGEQGALAELASAVDPFVGGTLGRILAGRRLPSWLEGEDLRQQAYIEIAELVLDWDPDRSSNFTPYLLGTFPWRLYHYLRAQTPATRAERVRVESVPHDTLMELAGESAGADGREWDGDLICRELLGALKPAQRSVVVLHAVLGYSFSEIGELIGRRKSSVHEAFGRAAADLRAAAA